MMMEDNPTSQNHAEQLGAPSPPTNSINVSGKQNQDDQRPHYSIPGILHFIQHEWTRFEMERAQWEVERAELQARIAFLQGERKGQENLKHDLIRRIKMLEYALKQERAKLHKFKYGTDPSPADLKVPIFDDMGKDEQCDGELLIANNSNVSWQKGRQLLRQYLQEIGYTDTIIDVRSSRVRTLLGLSPNNMDSNEKQTTFSTMNDHINKGVNDTQIRRIPAKKFPNSITENALLDAEASVLATFDFLASENADMDDDEDGFSDEIDECNMADEDEHLEKRMKSKSQGIGNDTVATRVDEVMRDAETEEVLSEFDFLGPDAAEGAGEARSQGDGSDWEKSDGCSEEEWGSNPQIINKLVEEYRKEKKNRKGASQRPKRVIFRSLHASHSVGDDRDSQHLSDSKTPSKEALCLFPSVTNPSNDSNVNDDVGPNLDYILDLIGSRTGFRPEAEENGVQSGPLLFPPGSRHPLLGGTGNNEDSLEAPLGLGELAGLTVNNEADSTYDISSAQEAFRKTWNAKYTLRSHFDGVRSLAFHPVEPVLITASEDHTLKLWNLQKTVPAKKTASLDVEPVYTFRGHVGPVLCLVLGVMGEQCFSGGLDQTIRCWNVPSSNSDPYDLFDPGVLTATLQGHTDAVWGLSIHSSKLQLLSCSADGTVRLWSPHSKVPLLHTYGSDKDDGTPTSVDFIHCDPLQMVTAYNSSNAVIFDLETGKPVVRLESNQNPEISQQNKQINRIISHPTLPVTVTAHEDRHIRFFDNNTGQMVHSMVAHLDAVTSLAIDPNGLYVLSGSHDCSIRLWNMDNKTCVQEITSHRKKFDEAIFDVAFHPSKPFIASAGADALAKVFV
ncbi:striatin-3-like isoform X1 [Centruroides vittatus]|uniref:striatin-3-like isoform X1 n=1 Tax=Centruroides vittatus TaxID=120091 RepID=UPI003510BFB5